MRRTPVIVVAGHLGSGKTTLLNHVLRHSGARIGVVVNDIGRVDIDALLLQGHVDARAFGGSCLCCLADPSELDDALRALQGLDLDAIVIEGSGLAEPRELARLVLASTVRGIRFGGVVVLVDAAEWDEGPPVARDHVQVASLLVVTKGDRSPVPMAQIRAELQQLAPGTAVVEAAHGALDPALLLDIDDRAPTTGQLTLADVLREQPHESHAHAERSAVTVTVVDERALHPGPWAALLEEPPAGTYRIKAIAPVVGLGTVVTHGVGRWVGVERHVGEPSQGSVIVVIGIDLDEEEVQRQIDACFAEPGQQATAEQVHALARLRR